MSSRDLQLMVDKKPQFMGMNTIVFNGTTFAQSVATRTPSVISGMMVMEIFKVFFEFPATAFPDNDAILEMIGQITSQSQTAILNISNSSVIAMARLSEQINYAESTETGGGATSSNRILVMDVSDGAGNGLLTAAEELFLGVIASSNNVTVTGAAKILYKAVKVNAEELIGLAKSSA